MFKMPFLSKNITLTTSGGQRCPYCLAPLEKKEILRWTEVDNRGFIIGYVCSNCGWWEKSERYAYDRKCDSGWREMWHVEYLIGEARRYHITAMDVPIGDLRRFLQRHPHHMAHINPTVFEKLMADCLRSRYGPCDVCHVGRSGDGGIDLILSRGDMGTFLIQVKRRGNLRPKEGVQVVRELNGVLFREGHAKGMVITTASDFTPAAYRETLIKTPTTETYEIRLLAFKDIISMLDLPPTETYEPWKNAIVTEKPNTPLNGMVEATSR